MNKQYGTNLAIAIAIVSAIWFCAGFVWGFKMAKATYSEKAAIYQADK